MTEPLVSTLPLHEAAIHVDARVGDEVVLQGAYTSTFDGSVTDAATTTWPKDAPGGGSVDAGGVFEISDAYGLHLASRDPATHEVHAVVTGDGAEACAAFGVAAPCLPSRLRAQALSRLMPRDEWASTLQGRITLAVPPPPAIAPPPGVVPYLSYGAGALAVFAACALALRYRKRRAESPAGRLLAQARRVRDKLARADGVVAAPLAPAVDAAIEALRARRVDAASGEGKRIAAALQRVELRLDTSVRDARALEEQQAADELVREFESALEAADEVMLAGKGEG